MESLSESPYLQYNLDTLDHIRREYGIDQPIRMIEMVDVLEEWVGKQKHFVVNSLPRKYLERMIIFNKGSVEKTKRKLDKTCTIRTLLPELFENHNIDELSLCQDSLMDVMLPKMTSDYCRVHMFKARNKIKMDSVVCTRYFKLFVIIAEYLQLYDYNMGLMYLADWRDVSIMDFVTTCNFAEFRRAMDITFEGFSMRIKAIHLLTESKAVSALVTLFKQVMSAKIGSRIQVHSSLDSVYNYIDKNVLPAEYGGTEKPLLELQVDFLRELKSDHFVEYRRKMSKARTDEAFRDKDKFNDYMGMSGTFRNLTVD